MTDRPLFVHRPPSENSRSDEEAEALLTGQRAAGKPENRTTFWRQAILFTWAFIATITVIILVALYQHEDGAKSPGSKPKADGKRNLIFMVSDGMGPASLSLTRSFRQFHEDLPADDILTLDKHHIGTSRTRSSSSLITDSAAGATAFSCVSKSYNGAISVLPDGSPCGTVLEAAKMAGYKTGLVVTTRITDATPACFASHAYMRSYENLIAEHEIGEYPLGRVVDLILGGGRCHFLPNSSAGSCRHDDKDLVQIAKSKGFSYIDDRPGFDSLKNGSVVTLPLLGLLAPTDIPYEIDRRSQNEIYPSLEETTRTALRALSDATEDSDKGFFIMIEGSRIDHAGHSNDPAAQVHEVLAYDRAVAAALEFLAEDSVPGVLVSTSDHETGGLSVARQLHEDYPDYLWYPEVLARANHSAEHLHRQIRTYLTGDGRDADKATQKEYVRRHLVENGLGITDASDKEMEQLISHTSDGDINKLGHVGGGPMFADMISRRAQIGWSSHGHSGRPSTSSPYQQNSHLCQTRTLTLL